MSSETDQGGADAAPVKPAASLLTIPLFKTARSRRADRTLSNERRPLNAEDPAEVQDTHRYRSPPVRATEERPVREQPRAPESSPEKPVAVEARHLRQYWRRVASGGVPAIEELDESTIARNWPYTLLIRVPDDALVDIVHVYAPQPGRTPDSAEPEGHPLAQDHYSQLSAWLLRLARETAPTRAPRETTESFPMAGGLRSFTAQAMPCQSRNDAAAYVLLNISRA